MIKSNSKTTIATKIIFYASLLSIVLFFLTPIFFINRLKDGVEVIWGFDAILGLKPTYDFNWYIYIACIVFLIMGVTTYYIGPKSKGYYIFSSIVYVVLAVICFNSISWFINGSMHFDNGSFIKNNTYLGIGPWFGGIASIISVIACIVDFRTFKLR